MGSHTCSKRLSVWVMGVGIPQWVCWELKEEVLVLCLCDVSMASIVSESIHYFLNTFPLTTHLDALSGLLGVTFWHTKLPLQCSKTIKKNSQSHIQTRQDDSYWSTYLSLSSVQSGCFIISESSFTPDSSGLL